MSNDWKAAVHILESFQLMKKGSYEWINEARKEIRFSEVDTSGWSHGELLLFNLARDLFDGGGDVVRVSELIAVLDTDNFRRALQAIAMRRGIPFWALLDGKDEGDV